MKWLSYGIAYTIFGAIILFFLTMLGTTVYALVTWDMDAWMNVIRWLNPATNIIVRIVSLIGTLIAFIGGWLSYQVNG